VIADAAYVRAKRGAPCPVQPRRPRQARRAITKSSLGRRSFQTVSGPTSGSAVSRWPSHARAVPATHRWPLGA
jgi:hypothetical protein